MKGGENHLLESYVDLLAAYGSWTAEVVQIPFFVAAFLQGLGTAYAFMMPRSS